MRDLRKRVIEQKRLKERRRRQQEANVLRKKEEREQHKCVCVCVFQNVSGSIQFHCQLQAEVFGWSRSC